jgi:hypothetical protein
MKSLSADQKRNLIAWNRRISWGIVGLSLATSLVRGLLPAFATANTMVLDGISGVAFLYTLFHIGLAVWMYRLPRFEWRMKSMFVWCGYAMIPTLIIGAAAYGTPLARVNYVVSSVFFVLHITLGAWKALLHMNAHKPLQYSLTSLAAASMLLASVLGWMTEM